MSEYMIRGTAADDQLRVFAATTREMVEKGRQIHNTSPVMTAALGRLMTGAVMMGAMMKGEQNLLTVSIRSDGPAQGLTVTSDSKGNVKGYVNCPDVVLPANALGKLDVGGAVGKGVLRVTKDMGLKEPYVGQVDLVSGEIAEDLTYYFASSEQVPSSVALGVLMEKNNTVRQAGGFILQVMPFAEEAVISKLEERLGAFSSMTAHLDREETPEDILESLFQDMGLKLYEKLPVQYACNCSRERVTKALISIGEKEIKEMIKEGQPVEMNCHFCGKNYIFSIEDLKGLL